MNLRDCEDENRKSPGVGRSNVSRLWQEVGHKLVDAFREKSLTTQDWGLQMLDGIRLSKDETAVVAKLEVQHLFLALRRDPDRLGSIAP